MTDSLYERIGGEAAIDAAVEVFYQKVLADPELAPFFTKTDMAAQIAKQREFITYVFGGKTSYSGRDLRDSHKNATMHEQHSFRSRNDVSYPNSG